MLIDKHFSSLIHFNSDDVNLAYHTLLPLEVHGATYCNMKLLTKQCYMPQTVSNNWLSHRQCVINSIS